MNLCQFFLKFRNFTHHVSWLVGFHYSLILLCVVLQVKKKNNPNHKTLQNLVSCFLFYNPLVYTGLRKQRFYYYYSFLHITLPLNSTIKLPTELLKRKKQKIVFGLLFKMMGKPILLMHLVITILKYEKLFKPQNRRKNLLYA